MDPPPGEIEYISLLERHVEHRLAESIPLQIHRMLPRQSRERCIYLPPLLPLGLHDENVDVIVVWGETLAPGWRQVG